MTTWSTFDGSDAEWDLLIHQLGGNSPFATSGWARTKAAGRWTTTRVVGMIDGEVTAVAQIFWFTILRAITIGWIPGGIACRGSLTVAGLASWFADFSRGPFSYLRSAFHYPSQPADEHELTSNDWSNSPSYIGARETFVIKRLSGKLANSSRLSSNWKRNLERGLKRNDRVSVWLMPNVSEVNSLMREMVEFKKSKGPEAVATDESLSVLFDQMHDQIVIVQVRNSQEKIQAVRGAFVVGNFAWDALAAAGVDARKNYASYVCAWRLIEELDRRGVIEFDLAGIDELRNEGVFNFKKGLGGERITYLGEWDWANSPLVQRLARIAISRLG